MKNRMNHVRVLAGGLAAIITMSSMSSIAFAAEAEHLEQPVEQIVESSSETPIETPTEEIMTNAVDTENSDTIEKIAKDRTVENSNDEVVAEAASEQEAVKTKTVEAKMMEQDEAASEQEVAKTKTVENSNDEVVAEDSIEKVDEETAEKNEAAPEVTAEKFWDELVKKIDNIFPSKEDYTFTNEEESDGALVKYYKDASNRTIARTYYADGSFFEKVYSPEMHVEAPTVYGATSSIGTIVQPEWIYETMSCDADGNWKSTVYGICNQVESETAYTSTELEKKHKDADREKKLLEEAKNIEENATLDDILDFFNKMDTEPEAAKAYGESGATEKVEMDKVNGEVPEIIKFAYDKALDKALKTLPGSSIYADKAKGLIMKAMGLDSKSTDIAKTIKDRIDESDAKTGTLIASVKRLEPVVDALNSIGHDLDEFTNSTMLAATLMNSWVEDTKVSATKKLIEMASVIGTGSDWRAGNSSIFKDMNNGALALRSKNGDGPQASIDCKNLYELFYDYHKETSMFSGEAIDKAAADIQKRVQNFAENCSLVLDILKLQDQVVKLSDEEVASLDKTTRAKYEKIMEDKDYIQSYKKSVATIFTGDKNSNVEKCKYGVIQAVKDYSAKNRLVFLEQSENGISETKLKAQLYTQKSEVAKQSTLKSHSALSEKQICKLQEHVNSMDMTMQDYLEKVGFDMTPLKNTDRTGYLSTLKVSTYSMHSGKNGGGTNSKDYTAINMIQKNAKEESKESYYHYKHHWFWEKDVDRVNRDGLLVVLQKAK